MQQVYDSIDKLIRYAEKNLLLDKKNVDYVRNGIFRFLGLDSYGSGNTDDVNDTSPEKLLEDFVKACVEAKLFKHEESGYYCDEVMGELMLSPKDIQDKFCSVSKDMDNTAAMQWFYDYSVKSDYVKKAVLDKNPRFESEGLIITINKAKPEFRDPKKAASGNSTAGGYPKCSICHQNEGFAGRNKRTLRTVDITLGSQPWFWQYSPYGYFNQHGIAVNYEHTPMHVDKSAFTRLMDFVDMFPHYFIGCNAALPRIGGSVLAHDHYQGGGEILPMHRAKAAYTMTSKKYSDAVVEILDWAGTVIRVVSKNRRAVQEISQAVLNKWTVFEDKSLGIIPQDNDGVHSAVSPTVVKTGRGYEMSIILRNNITSEQYPDGVFHAHPEFHIIKKESIGLIEAQGLFILPGRLEAELGEIKELIKQGKPLKKELSQFSQIYDEIKQRCAGDISENSVQSAVESTLGSICNRILENTAVFKDKMQTVQFMKDLGFDL